MEAELLRGMISDREERISLIESKIKDANEREEQLKNALDDIIQRNQQAVLDNQMEKTRLLHAREAVLERLEIVQRDLANQGASLQSYASAGGAGGGGGGTRFTAHNQPEIAISGSGTQIGFSDANYVMRMQAQLCKAMHSMGIIDHQLELVKDHADKIHKIQKDQLSSLTEEKSQLELRLLNELMETDTVCRQAELELKIKLSEIRKEIELLEIQIEESRNDESDDEEDEEEDDEEEKEAKDELMKMLEEKRGAMMKLEADTDEQLAKIEELQEKLAKLGIDESKLRESGCDPIVKKIKRSPSAVDGAVPPPPSVDGIVALPLSPRRRAVLEKKVSVREEDGGNENNQDEDLSISVFDQVPQEEQDQLIMSQQSQRMLMAPSAGDDDEEEEEEGDGSTKDTSLRGSTLRGSTLRSSGMNSLIFNSSRRKVAEDVEDVNEHDLLNLVRARLSGSSSALLAHQGGSDEESSDEEDSDEEEEDDEDEDHEGEPVEEGTDEHSNAGDDDRGADDSPVKEKEDGTSKITATENGVVSNGIITEEHKVVEEDPAKEDQ